MVRDPVDMLVSVYSSHHKPEFKGERHYTGDLTFDQFLESFRQRQSWQLIPQVQRLRDKTGRVQLDYVIDFDHLEAQFAEVLSLIGLPPTPLPTFNESPDVMSATGVPAETRARIAEDYRKDIRIRRLMSGRWLRAPAAPANPDAAAVPEAAR